MAKRSGGFRRTSSTSKGTGVRRTTTYNRTKGITRSTSVKSGKYNRTTYTRTPKGELKITKTAKGASGFITRTIKNHSKVSKPKFAKTKVTKAPKIKFANPPKTKTKTYRPRRSRSTGGNIGAGWLIIAVIILLFIAAL